VLNALKNRFATEDTTVPVPTPEEVMPSVRTARDTRDRVSISIRSLETERDRVVSGLNVAPDREAAARAILEQHATDGARPLSGTEEARLETHRRELSAITVTLRDTRNALHIANQDLDRERSRAAAAVKPTLDPSRRALAARLYAALETITAICAEEDEIVDRVQRAGWPSHVFPTTAAGFVTSLRLDNEWSSASLWLSDARKAGLVD
jgi:hypothetical protein